MGLFSFLTGGSSLKQVLQKGAVIIDVRTAQEFDQGKLPGSINIPVDRISINLQRIRDMNKPIILVCSSGIRSRTATQLLRQKGMKQVYNGGNWEKVLRLMRKN